MDLHFCMMYAGADLWDQDVPEYGVDFELDKGAWHAGLG